MDNTRETQAATEPWFQGGSVSVQVQSVLYNNDPDDIRRALDSLARASELAAIAGFCKKTHVAFGDSSSSPCIGPRTFTELQAEYLSTLTLAYDFFGANLGSARGHNRLAAAATSDFILVQNPDIVVSPRLLERLLETFSKPGVGMVEAKQLPIEHPKDYDSHTGETSWATTASAMVPRELFNRLGGFDADAFFLYCDDVDFSWLVRQAGYTVVHQPAAVVFHDKRLSVKGEWQPSTSERYYSAEAALILAHKWSRPDVVERVLAHFDETGDKYQSDAARAYRVRVAEGRLPTPRDPDHRIGQFVEIFYAKHRYSL